MAYYGLLSCLGSLLESYEKILTSIELCAKLAHNLLVPVYKEQLDK